MCWRNSKSFTAKDAKVAEEQKCLTAKETIIRSKAEPEGREGTAPRVAYKSASGSEMWGTEKSA